MSKHFYIAQSKERSEQNINSKVIEKIYKLIDDDNRLGNILDNTSEFIGQITVQYTFRKYIDTIYERFPSETYLYINHDDLYIYFEDDIVRQIFSETFANGAEGILSTQKFNTNDGFYYNFRHIFQNSEIETFDELNQLTNATVFGTSEFEGCTKLRSINLSNVEKIGQKAFQGCELLAIDLCVPKLNQMNAWAFSECYSLQSISNLGILTSISTDVFRNCTSLTEIKNNALSNITSIGDGAFENCESLTTLGELSENLTIINKQAFKGCSSLLSFQFNENITEIREKTFYNCTSLTINNFNFPNLTTLQNDAFNGCSSLVIDDLNLPNLTTLGNSVFYNTQLKKISNLGNITTLNGGKFKNCKYLQEIAPGALDNVTIVGNHCFEGCTNENFDYICLGPNLETISAAPFSSWCHANLIIKNPTTVPAAISSPFHQYNKKIYVTDSLVDTYKTTEGYGSVASNILPISDLPENIKTKYNLI